MARGQASTGTGAQRSRGAGGQRRPKLEVASGGRRVRGLSLSAFAVAALLFLSGCTTFAYRNAQRDFNTAVQADNVRSVEALGALTASQSEPLYERVRARLTDRNIGHLDERLRPNAYAIRAVSEWRLGKLEDARNTAAAGLQLPNVGASPRDEIVLRIIPALVIDEQLVTQFRTAGFTVTKRDYDVTYAKDYATAAAVLGRAAASVKPSMPDSVVYYVALQRWRILQNWRVIISKIQDGHDAREAARDEAAKALGAPLADEIKRVEDLVPPGDPLRKLMETLALR